MCRVLHVANGLTLALIRNQKQKKTRMLVNAVEPPKPDWNIFNINGL